MAVFFQEKTGKFRDILFPFPKRRHGYIDDIQPVIEVLPETSCSDQVREVFVCGCDDPGIDSEDLVSADPPVFPGIQKTEQVRLKP